MLRNEDITRTMIITVEIMAIITVITVAEIMVATAEMDDVKKIKKPFSVILKGFLKIFYFQSKSYLTLRYSFNSMDALP